MAEWLYRIAGKSNVTGKTWYDTEKFSLKSAQATVDQLNNDLENQALGLVYWVEWAESPEPEPVAEVGYFVELAWDEYGNRGYTPRAEVIMAEVERHEGATPGTFGAAPTLHIIEPDDIKTKWPTINGLHWVKVEHEPGPITDDEREELIKAVTWPWWE